MSSDSSKNSDFSVPAATRFFIPLAIQTISQSFTYPLVASVVVHGANGVAVYGAFAQALTVFFLFNSIGIGLITTGMVFGKSKCGLRSFFRLTYALAGAVMLLMVVTSQHPAGEVVFGKFLGMPPDLELVSRTTLLLSVPALTLFFLRNPYHAILYNARASAAANSATLGRVVFTLMLTYLFVKIGFVGYRAGVVALTVPIIGELVASRILAQKYIRALPERGEGDAGVKEQLFFTVPLSLGGMLLSSSGFMVAAFISRAIDPLRMLPVHYIALGLVSPLAYAAMRMQAVVLAFPPRPGRYGRRTFLFGVGAGLIMAAITLAGQMPLVARYYFGRVQNLTPADIKLASHAMLVALPLPIIQAIRGHAEGLAAWYKRPKTIMAGQAVYLGVLIYSLNTLLKIGAPGYLMGVISMIAASLAAFLTIRGGMIFKGK